MRNRNIPWEMKSCDGQAKGILRRALRGVVPDDVLQRRKVPYPRTFNPGYHAAVRSWVRRILADPASPLRPLLDRAFLLRLTEADAPPDLQWFGQTMSGAQFYAYLCQVDAWMRAYRVRVV
jgi:asparagine synthase (glutamine-hydrolysing)